jgi:hypothetical protein
MDMAVLIFEGSDVLSVNLHYGGITQIELVEGFRFA